MAAGLPIDRASFKAFCLRRLGDGVITVNLSDDQIEDCVDIAVQYWNDFHVEGTEKVYFTHILTQAEINQMFITLPSNIIGAVDIFDLGDVYGMQNMFNIRYQIALNDLYTLTSVSMVPYFMALSHLQFMEQLLIGKQPLRYNRYDNNLFLDMDWSFVTPGQFIIVKAYQVVNPDVLTGAWQDRFLHRYATALMKRDWGNNLKKYGDMKLPDGNVIKGQQIYDEAIQEIKDLENEMVTTWSPYVIDMIGALILGILSMPLIYNIINILPLYT